MEYCLIYITTKDKEEAESIASHLLNEKLIACANILSSMNSLYIWENNTQKESEVLLIAKTSLKHYNAIEKRVKQLHSYKCPAILALPILAGSEEYVSWIKKSIL